MPSFRYRAFISYCHRDRKSAARLQTALENFRLPRPDTGPDAPRLRPVFRDREELGSSHDLTAAIRGALDESEYLIVVCSRRAAGSRWVAAEILHFIGKRGPENILCFIVDGEPNSPAPALECLPEPLRGPVSGREVLAADARKQGDGWTDAVLRTVAGLTGLRFADLARREQARLRRRALVSASLGLLLAAIFGALAVYSAQQAKAATKSAKSAELIAEYLEQVLFQFSPREGENAARAALLPLIDASTRPDRLATLETEPMALLRVRYILGRAYLELNAADRALPLLEANVSMATKLFGPDHGATLTSLWSLGNTLNAVGQHERGAEVHEHLLDTAVRVHGNQSEEALGAMTNLAISLELAGRQDEADALRTRVYEVGSTFLPADYTPFHGARLNYASILWKQGKLEQTLALLEELHRDQLQSLGPEHLATAETESFLGEVCEASGAPERAATIYAAAAKTLVRIQGPDDGRALFCAFQLAHILQKFGRKDEAAAVAKQYFGRPPDPRKLRIIGKKPSDLPR